MALGRRGMQHTNQRAVPTARRAKSAFQRSSVASPKQTTSRTVQEPRRIKVMPNCIPDNEASTDGADAGSANLRQVGPMLTSCEG